MEVILLCVAILFLTMRFKSNSLTAGIHCTILLYSYLKYITLPHLPTHLCKTDLTDNLQYDHDQQPNNLPCVN